MLLIVGFYYHLMEYLWLSFVCEEDLITAGLVELIKFTEIFSVGVAFSASLKNLPKVPLTDNHLLVRSNLSMLTS